MIAAVARRMHAVWLAGLVLVCATPIITHAQPEWEDFTLPPGIAGKAERFLDAVSTGGEMSKEPDQRQHFEIHREWVRNELWLREGGFGWQLSDFTMDTLDDSLTYNASSSRGIRMHRLNVYGDSRSDGISPISWIRKLQVRSKAGEPVDVERTDQYTIYTCQGAGTYGKFRVFVDDADRIVRAEELYPGSDKPQIVYKYTDWVPVGPAAEHPRTVHTVIFPNKGTEGDPLYDVTKIVEMQPLGLDAEPTGYTLPVEAIITDYIENVLRDGEGNIIGDLSDAIEASTAGTGPNPPFRLSSGWLAGGGVLLLVGAAVIWEVRRRRG